MGEPLRIGVSRAGTRVDLVLRGDLDAPAVPVIRERLWPLLGQGGHQVVAEVSGVTSVDIPGLAALVRFDLLLRRVSSTLTVAGPTPAFRALLRSTGLDRRLRVRG